MPTSPPKDPARSFEAEVLPMRGQLKDRAMRFLRYPAWGISLHNARASADAEDLVQETMLRAWKAWGRYDVKNVWGWLWLIMRNVFLDSRGDHARWTGLLDAHVDEIGEVRASAPPAPDARLTAGPDDRFFAALQQLPEAQRKVIELQVIGLDDIETARHLKINLKTVRTAAHKGRQRLRAAL